ncbi:MAG TPA: ketoacyl-ACP synthase III [Candidatus Binatia bacterium]|jgi:3-oxoacyl-[acyl-carrier-protein] synthase-3
MAKSTMKGMAVRGVVACIPPREISNENDYPWFDAMEIRKITAMAGIKSRHQVESDTCTSDLCFAAARSLLQRLEWDPPSVDGLILVTQTPDYVMPTTSCILQHRLGLPDTCAAFDVALGCSAYVYGVWLSNALLASGGCRRILLLTGETPSKFIDPKDRTTALLFGDAGSATALEATDDPGSEAHYIMMTDGSGATDLIVPGGMFRNRFPGEPAQYCLHMDGGHIFDFTRNRVPPLINDLLALSGKSPQDYAYFIFHQANEYLIKFLASKARISLTQVPFSIAQFGNTGAASVPLTLALAGPPTVESDTYNVMLLGFGVGLSWGGVSLRIARECVLGHFTYGENGGNPKGQHSAS